ncbi:MAG: hypothetical protein QOE03_969 [Micromonosporaceae bacterium]|nr:hypothetical protein [Micromonosporaceae bacterium]
MIAGTLLLVLIAVVTMALGLVGGSDAYLVGSITASLLAAIALIAGSRRASAARSGLVGDNSVPAGSMPPDSASAGSTRARSAAWAGDRTGVRAATYGTPRREPMTEATPAGASGSGERDESGSMDPYDQDAGDRYGEERTGRHTMVAVLDSAVPAQGGPSGGARLVDDADADDDDDDDDPPGEPAAQQVSAADAARVARMSNEVMVVDGRPRYHLVGCSHLVGRDGEPLPVHEAVELGFTPCSRCEPDSALLAHARRV